MQKRRTSQAGWWLALAGIVAAALLIRLAGYNFSLPYVDHPDEPVFYLTGREWRGLFDAGNYLAGYPPLYIWLNIAVQLILEPLGIQGTAATVELLRLISIGFSLLTLVLITFIARRGGGWIAGIIAGAAWAFAPMAVENGVYATPDPLVYLLVIASVALAVVALTDERRAHWCVWSVVIGCLAILTKYYVLSALLPGIGVAVWLYRRDPRRGRRTLALQAGLIAVTLLVSAVGIAVLGREGATARSEGFANALNPSRVLNNLYYALLPINPLFFGIALILGAAAYGIGRRVRRVRIDVVALCALMLVSIPWLAAAFSVVTASERMKDVLPATTVACVIVGIGLAQIAAVLPRLLRGFVVLAPALVVFAPQLSADFSLMRERELPDTRVALRQWADANLTPGTVLVGSINHKTFNPFWGGIEGQHWFDWIVSDDMLAQTPESWRSAQGVSYIVFDNGGWSQLQNNPAGQPFLAQMLPLRAFASTDEATRGPQMMVYRLWGVQHPLQARFGDAINLIGYDLSSEAAAAGSDVTLTFYWRATSAPTDNYSLFVHLVPVGGEQLIAQADGAPARPERPTLSWTDSSETLISLPFTLAIAPDAAPGRYELRIGLYNYQSGARLPVVADMNNLGDSLILAAISIQ